MAEASPPLSRVLLRRKGDRRHPRRVRLLDFLIEMKSNVNPQALRSGRRVNVFGGRIAPPTGMVEIAYDMYALNYLCAIMNDRAQFSLCLVRGGTVIVVPNPQLTCVSSSEAAGCIRFAFRGRRNP